MEDNAAEQMSIKELLDHDDIEIVTTDTGAERALDVARQSVRLRRARSAAARHERFRGARQIRKDDALSNVPVVVFTGRELSVEEDAELHTMARSIVVKGVESPERLLDETSLFLHRVITELPIEKQRMLEKLNSSDEDLVGQTALLVDDDARNIFALSSVLERRGMKVLTATTGSEAVALVEVQPRDRDRPDGYHDAADGRLSDHRRHPRKSGVPPASHHRAYRQGDEGRPGEMSGGRRFRLSGQAGQHRTVAPRHTHVAAPLIGMAR